MGVKMRAHTKDNLDPQNDQSEEYQICLAQCCGKKIGPLAAEALFPKIRKHKWLLSEKLNRDVGMKIATLDYLENGIHSQGIIDPITL